MDTSDSNSLARGGFALFMGTGTVVVLASVLFSVAGRPPAAASEFDPLAVAFKPRRKDRNVEATVPSMCYTKTDGLSNVCWTCHTTPVAPNRREDWNLQETYAFGNFALTNRWSNLFVDRRQDLAAMSDADILRYIREDNYSPLRAALLERKGYIGYKLDLDFTRGFDEEGFARDGSGWRAIRYKPFPGTFWPTNGSTDDVMIRLPSKFRTDEQGHESRRIYRLNLSILESAVATAPGQPDRPIERVEEAPAGGTLPSRYAGAAADVVVRRHRHPEGTEYLHTVRYLDPDVPSLLSTRMKEVRYSRKFQDPDDWTVTQQYYREDEEKQEGLISSFPGSPDTGFRNGFGWLLQGFIEDASGRLRVQSAEEHRNCLGCHSALGVTVDSTFTLARKVPGAGGWRPQDLRGMPDAPQAGHREPEVLTYLRRAGGGDEFRANDEMLRKFFSGGRLSEEAVRAAKDMAELVGPSRERALLLDKAYRWIVLRQSFVLGRDPLPLPAKNVHARIPNATTSTGLREAGRVYKDGRLWLDWPR